MVEWCKRKEVARRLQGGCKEVARRGCSVIFIEGIRYGIAGAAQAP
jgi:hypothetical protein